MRSMELGGGIATLVWNSSSRQLQDGRHGFQIATADAENSSKMATDSFRMELRIAILFLQKIESAGMEFAGGEN